MNANEAIKMYIDCADMVCGAYLGDVSNEEAMKRPHAGQWVVVRRELGCEIVI